MKQAKRGVLSGERKRAVLYMRLSVSSDDSVSLARQRGQLEDLCAREGMEVVEVLEDDGISGGKRRANADLALDMLRQGQADAIVCASLDRWSRQGLQAVAELMQVLDEHPGTAFITANGLRSTDSTFGLIAAVVAEIAKAEREATRERVKLARRHLATSEHRWPAGRTVYGYRTCPHPSGVGKGLEPDPVEAPLVVELFERVAGGESVLAIAKDWNGRGLRTRDTDTRSGIHKPGVEWTTTRLLRLLRNDSMLGRMTHHGKALVDPKGYPLVVWEPLVSLDLWQAVQAILDRHEKTGPRHRRESLLVGVLRCASCGSGMTYEERGGQSALYRCVGAKQGKSCGEPVAISASLIEPYIEREFLHRYGEMEEITRVAVDTTASRRAEIESAISSTLAAIGDAESDEEAHRLTNLMRDMKRELADLPTGIEEAWQPTGRTYGEAWREAAVAQRRTLVSSVMSLVSVRRARARGVRTIEPGRVRIIARVIEPRVPGVTMARSYAEQAEEDGEASWIDEI